MKGMIIFWVKGKFDQRLSWYTFKFIKIIPPPGQAIPNRPWDFVINTRLGLLFLKPEGQGLLVSKTRARGTFGF